MNRGAVPDEVLRFIERRIDSVPHLEALLLLWESPSTTWTDAAIAARVYVSREQAQILLQDLTRHGLIAGDGSTPERYAYNSSWDEAQLMTRVAASYRRHLVDLARLIHMKAASQAVRDFARAFQFKDEE